MSDFTPAPQPSELTRTVIQLVWDSVSGYSAQYQFVLVDPTGQRVRVIKDGGDLMPYMTTAQQAQAKAFVDLITAKGQALIPAP